MGMKMKTNYLARIRLYLCLIFPRSKATNKSNSNPTMEMEGRTLGGVGNNRKVKQCMTTLQETEKRRSKNPNPNYNKLRAITIVVLKVIRIGDVKLTKSWKNQKFGQQATKPNKQTLNTLHQILIKLT